MNASSLSSNVLTKKNPFSIILSGKTVLSGCCGDASYPDADRLPDIRSDLFIEPSTIKTIMKDTLVSELHNRTGGIIS
jgi:FdhD protein